MFYTVKMHNLKISITNNRICFQSGEIGTPIQFLVEVDNHVATLETVTALQKLKHRVAM